MKLGFFFLLIKKTSCSYNISLLENMYHQYVLYFISILTSNIILQIYINISHLFSMMRRFVLTHQMINTRTYHYKIFWTISADVFAYV